MFCCVFCCVFLFVGNDRRNERRDSAASNTPSISSAPAVVSYDDFTWIDTTSHLVLSSVVQLFAKYFNKSKNLLEPMMHLLCDFISMVFNCFFCFFLFLFFVCIVCIIIFINRVLFFVFCICICICVLR